MKERPILFSGPMVRAILDGKKTQTRRVVKPQFGKVWGQGVRHGDDAYSAHVAIAVPDGWQWVKCPYGQPGDRLWVRETHAIVPTTAYRASAGVCQTVNPDDPDHAAIYRAGWDRSDPGTRWRPSIHMPRWASRIMLEVVSVRVERVQSITPRDVVAEGLYHEPGEWGPDEAYDHLIKAFAQLWDTINATRGYGWAVNPWVWVVEFREVAR